MASSNWISPFGAFSFNGSTFAVNATLLNIPALGIYGWSSSSDPSAAADTGISRTSAGNIAFGTGAQGNSGATVAMGSLLLSAGGGITWSTRGAIGSPSDSVFQLGANAFTTGVRLDVSTNGTLKVLNFAGTAATGTIDAGAGFSNNGTAGVATFGPSAVASITVKGGIVTAIS